MSVETTHLSDDHPISFIYNSSLAAEDGELHDPSRLPGPIRLENEKLQCTSCHDPHDNINGHFLVITTQNSALCLECHDPADVAPEGTHAPVVGAVPGP